MSDCIYCGGVIGESCFDPQMCQEMAYIRDNKVETQRDSLLDLTLKLQAHLKDEIKRAGDRIGIYHGKGFIWQKQFTEGQRDAFGGVLRVLNDLCLSNVRELMRMNAEERLKIIVEFAALLERRIEQGVITDLEDLKTYLSGITACNPAVITFFTKCSKPKRK